MSEPKGDYLHFRDSVIVAVADDQEPPGLGILNLRELCDRRNITFYETWMRTISGDMQNQGWGQDCSNLDDPHFLINGSGLARAAEVRRAQASGGFSKWLAGINWSMWSVIVAAVALVAYVIFEAV